MSGRTDEAEGRRGSYWVLGPNLLVPTGDAEFTGIERLAKISYDQDQGVD
jgi:hypothetical protein